MIKARTTAVLLVYLEFVIMEQEHVVVIFGLIVFRITSLLLKYVMDWITIVMDTVMKV